MRGLACGVWLQSLSRTERESQALEREAAQLGVSGLGRHVAVKRAGMERREADWSAAAAAAARATATAERHAEKNHSRERDKGRRMCARSGDAGEPAGHNGGKHLSEGGTVCACVQPSH